MFTSLVGFNPLPRLGSNFCIRAWKVPTSTIGFAAPQISRSCGPAFDRRLNWCQDQFRQAARNLQEERTCHGRFGSFSNELIVVIPESMFHNLGSQVADIPIAGSPKRECHGEAFNGLTCARLVTTKEKSNTTFIIVHLHVHGEMEFPVTKGKLDLASQHQEISN